MPQSLYHVCEEFLRENKMEKFHSLKNLSQLESFPAKKLKFSCSAGDFEEIGEGKCDEKLKNCGDDEVVEEETCKCKSKTKRGKLESFEGFCSFCLID